MLQTANKNSKKSRSHVAFGNRRFLLRKLRPQTLRAIVSCLKRKIHERQPLVRLAVSSWLTFNFQEHKKKKAMQKAAKDSGYKRVLKEQITSAKRSLEDVLAPKNLPMKKRQKHSKDPRADEEVCWRSLYAETRKENEKLLNVLQSLQLCVDKKLSSIELLLQKCKGLPQTCTSRSQPIELEMAHGTQLSSSQASMVPSSPQQSLSHLLPSLEDNCSAPPSPLQLRDPDVPQSRTPEADEHVRGQVMLPPQLPDNLCASSPLDALSGAGAQAEPFTYLKNGKFHVNRGICIEAVQAQKVLQNHKATLVAKDMAHALWGPSILAERSVGGTVAPRDKRNPNCSARPRLSPIKVGVIIDTLTYWGKEKNVDTTGVIRNLNTILSDKIQDVKKALKKKGQSGDVQEDLS
ncbi:uncharacterized protein LOC135372000 [Ornithodoros turicata]|uniref:uncharacterized protein LOC135372000 n=1 Tax=Ornithodoros turicata TaxID=34597 RepID=UPI003138BAB6